MKETVENGATKKRMLTILFFFILKKIDLAESSKKTLGLFQFIQADDEEAERRNVPNSVPAKVRWKVLNKMDVTCGMQTG